MKELTLHLSRLALVLWWYLSRYLSSPWHNRNRLLPPALVIAFYSHFTFNAMSFLLVCHLHAAAARSGVAGQFVLPVV